MLAVRTAARSRRERSWKSLPPRPAHPQPRSEPPGRQRHRSPPTHRPQRTATPPARFRTRFFHPKPSSAPPYRHREPPLPPAPRSEGEAAPGQAASAKPHRALRSDSPAPPPRQRAAPSSRDTRGRHVMPPRRPVKPAAMRAAGSAVRRFIARGNRVSVTSLFTGAALSAKLPPPFSLAETCT
ncbi:serine/arginine repetitive matrix protein 1-like [Tympanuchus pallidicinctus]|uniref:serine/arginine repetitive matrix protein 1-like n=1 Tax=Tympanuchus pallidicinctus TaxID=109042 RepID=UPI0022870D43|nr:serine/arginine repetitive matrix protein 1-like [Tympanuchus pallidicinctus]